MILDPSQNSMCKQYRSRQISWELLFDSAPNSTMGLIALTSSDNLFLKPFENFCLSF